MSRSKPSKLSAERKLVQRHRVVRVTLKKIFFSIFLNFLCQTAKKFALRAISISALGWGTLLCRLKSPCSKSSKICA